MAETSGARKINASPQARSWIMTLNNPKQDPEEYLSAFHKGTKAQYVCGQLEKGEKGTPHIQFFAYWAQQKRCNGLKRFDKAIHIEKAVKPALALQYCMKNDTRVAGPWEFGQRPVFNEERKDKWAEAKELCKQRKFDDIEPKLYMRHPRNFHFVADQYQKLGKPYEQCRGIWIQGPSGTGKTTKAQTDFQGLFYYKNKDKWWDGYKDEQVVIMEDVSPETKYLVDYIKEWVDRFPFKSLIKGGHTYPDYSWFIITSQYSIEECFERDEDKIAIRRRCKVIHFEQ